MIRTHGNPLTKCQMIDQITAGKPGDILQHTVYRDYTAVVVRLAGGHGRPHSSPIPDIPPGKEVTIEVGLYKYSSNDNHISRVNMTRLVLRSRLSTAKKKTDLR